MKAGAFAAAAAVRGSRSRCSAPAEACPNGYEAVWIQGNKVCQIKTPKLNLKAKTKHELKKATRSGR